VVGADLAILAAHQDDRGVREVEALDLIVTGLGNFFFPTDREPIPFEDFLNLLVVVLF
jgi:hypothetical protein